MMLKLKPIFTEIMKTQYKNLNELSLTKCNPTKAGLVIMLLIAPANLMRAISTMNL